MLNSANRVGRINLTYTPIFEIEVNVFVLMY